jgi:hypothetical protein
MRESVYSDCIKAGMEGMKLFTGFHVVPPSFFQYKISVVSADKLVLHFLILLFVC